MRILGRPFDPVEDESTLNFSDVVLIGGVAAFISLLTIRSTMFVWIMKRL